MKWVFGYIYLQFVQAFIQHIPEMFWKISNAILSKYGWKLNISWDWGIQNNKVGKELERNNDTTTTKQNNEERCTGLDPKISQVYFF